MSDLPGCDEMVLHDVSLLLPVAVRLYAASAEEAGKMACLVRLAAQSGGFVDLSTGFPEIVKVVAVGETARPDRDALIDALIERLEASPSPRSNGHG